MTNIPSWPVDEDGRPMAIVIGSVVDTVKTAEYCSVRIGPTIMRPVPNGSREEVINASREVQRDAEYVCGVERRALLYALHPELRVANPAQDEHQFAAPPAAYDPASMPPHPSDAINAEPDPGDAKQDAKQDAPPAPAVPGMPDVALPASKA